jgi:hypothetical protein
MVSSYSLVRELSEPFFQTAEKNKIAHTTHHVVMQVNP